VSSEVDIEREPAGAVPETMARQADLSSKTKLELRAQSSEPVKIARIISRLNVGGPSIQAITLTHLLRRFGYQTRLLCGRENPSEGSMDYLARELEVCPVRIDSLSRNPATGDLRALLALTIELRRARPRLVHTHTAKAGTLGRLAALIALPRHRRILVHTFHGHSLTGYFNPVVARIYLAIERALARRTNKLIVVSEEVRDELVSLGVAPYTRFEVIPLGFDLRPFMAPSGDRDRQRNALRRELGVSPDAKVVTLVARLVPIKRVDRFLRVARLVAEQSNAHFMIAGDGELGDVLRASTDARALEDRLSWIGFRRDIPAVCFASDVVALTSDNEGTPVSLIEAQAAGVPVVSTDVGGVRSVVLDGRTGMMAVAGDDQGLADAILQTLQDTALARRLATAGRAHAVSAFSIERLVQNMDRLYASLLQGAPEAP
jgi:glycosyltransferase involved in cell wall biosynthesis